MRFIGALVAWIIVAIIAFFVFAYSGVYSVGADVPHWSITRDAIGLVREHAIDRRAAGMKVPPLDDPALIKVGAEHYSEMCVGCHLAPGVDHSELREGLYPKPPNLTRFSPDPAEAFWVIKHGLKMTAMPAWGKTHSDHLIWAMVAFLQKQPKMGVAEYQRLRGQGAAMESHDHDHGTRVEPAPATSARVPAPATTIVPTASTAAR
ncbi:MAG TPA: cytochrome c [Rhodanobacteraceae bacterium]|nr:cytochrome c [Rhodanobacteraceae bacterium]